jgi:Protein of unknown function (DUF3226)
VPRRLEFVNSRLILCEGYEDAAFANALLKGRKNLPAFDVSPNVDLAGVGGDSGFGDAVIACEAIVGFDRVNEIAILADNDEKPAASFTKLRKQIEKARREKNLSRNWGKATRPAEKALGDPAVSIWMWPSADQPGCLETLLWQAIETRYPREAACVQDVVRCSGIETWSASKLDKARVHCFIAVICKRSPSITLGFLWRYFPNIIPVTDRVFTPFANFLSAI